MKLEKFNSYIEVLNAIRDGRDWEFLGMDGKWYTPPGDTHFFFSAFMDSEIELRVKPEAP